MELTAEELQLIQDRRNAEAKKAEAAKLAARSVEEKAIEIFQKRAAANNALALDLVVELNAKHKGLYTATKINASEYSERVDHKTWMKASEVNFINFGAGRVNISDAFGNAVDIELNAAGFNDKGDVYKMREIYSIDARNYTGATDKNAIRICVNRLEQLRAKQVEKEIVEKKIANAKEHIKSCFPKATEVKVWNQDHYFKYEATAFEDTYKYTSAKGTVFFNEDLTVKSKSLSFDGVYGKGTEKDNLLKQLEEAKEAAIKEITKEFNKRMTQALNA
jgi:hypothetical protein